MGYSEALRAPRPVYPSPVGARASLHSSRQRRHRLSSTRSWEGRIQKQNFTGRTQEGKGCGWCQSRMTEAELLREYGVVHLRGVLDEKQQRELYLQIEDTAPKGKKVSPGNFHISSDGHRREPLHELGERLFSCVAQQLGALTSEDNVALTPSLKRMAEAYSGAVPIKVDHICGVAYWPGMVLDNHSDCAKPLYTMSLALGEACDFTVGQKTLKPRFWQKAPPSSGVARISMLLREPGWAKSM